MRPSDSAAFLKAGGGTCIHLPGRLRTCSQLRALRVCWWLFLMFPCAPALAETVSRGEEGSPPALADTGNPARSIESAPAERSRSRDVVILDDPRTGRIFQAQAPEAVRLYAHTGQGFSPIPFQIDFVGEDGLVIPEQVNRFLGQTVYDFTPNPDYPSRLAGRTQILFMAGDGGSRFPGPTLPERFERGMEIVVKDPLDGRVFYAYLLQPRPPAAEPTRSEDYVDYELVPDPGGRGRTQRIRSQGVIMGFADLTQPYVFTDWTVPVDAGGSGTDILQTVRIRMRIRFLFFTFDLDPRNNVFSSVLGFRDGPIRVTRRVRSSVMLGGIKMDRLMSQATLETESHYLRDFSFFDGSVAFPGLVKSVSKIRAVFTTDFNANAAGMIWTNSENDSGPGCLVDGRMSPQERRLETGPYQWALIQGPQGGWANILRVHNESVRPYMNLAYLDDGSYRDEKDPDLRGAWGATGFSLERLDRAEEKITWRSFVFSIPSGFTESDMEGLVRLVFHPLEAGMGRAWTPVAGAVPCSGTGSVTAPPRVPFPETVGEAGEHAGTKQRRP
jgi:hypothetical protein